MASFLRHFLTFFAITALFVQGIVPAGYMPSWKGDGKVEMVICTGTGTQIMRVDAVHDPFAAAKNENAPAHDEQQAGAPCPYAVAASPVLAAGPTALLPVFERTTEKRQPLFVLFRDSHAVKPWLAQGPPQA